jgi:signal transduction histidine kinase
MPTIHQAKWLIPTTACRKASPWLLGVWFLWGLVWAGTAAAQDHITQRGWLEDRRGQLTWPAVVQQRSQAFEGVLSLGFGQAPVWLRLRIDPKAQPAPSQVDEPLMLRIRPVYLDDIQIFDPLVGGKIGVIGDLHHPRGQFFEGLDFVVPIARGDAPRDIWLRLSSSSTRQLAVQAVNHDALHHMTSSQQLIFALYVSVILLFSIWGWVQWLFGREKVIGAFALKQAAALVFALGSLGYTRAFWPSDWPAAWLDTTTTLSSIFAVSAAIYFHISLILEFEPPPWVRYLLRVPMLLVPTKLLLIFFDHSMLALRINMVEILLTPFLFLGAVFLARVWDQQENLEKPVLARWVVIGFYSLLVLILLVASLPGLGLAKGGEIPLYLVQVHGLLTAFLILLMLQYRKHVQQARQRDTALALERSQLQALQERGIREEQEKLLAMLAHELKTPLSTMHMRLDADAQGSHEIRRAIRDMNAVIERCLQTAQFSDRQLQANLTPVDMVGVLQDVVSASAEPARVVMDAPDRWTVQTDQQLMHIVLSNLIENACKYAEPHSPIEVKLFSALAADGVTQKICFEVSNLPGRSGWPEAVQVFEKYYRSPHARRQAGTGLGLYLVRNLVQVLGGQIDYAPDESHVRFVVCLPL